MEEIKPISEANSYSQEEFYAYAYFIELQRGYKKYWAQRVFKNCFGKNPSKQQRLLCEICDQEEPPEAFYTLIDNHIEYWYQTNIKGTKLDKRKSDLV